MKKWLSLILTALTAVCCFGFAGCGGKDGKTVLYMYTEAGFPPYEYTDDAGNVVGADVDLMEEVAEILGYRLEVKNVAFGVIFEEVNNSDLAVGAAGITVNAERQQMVDFSMTYAKSQQYVILKKGTAAYAAAVAAQTENGIPVAALADIVIGVQESTSGNYLIEDAINGVEEDDGTHTPGDLEGKGSSLTTYKNALIAKMDLAGDNAALGAIVIDKLPAETIAASDETLEAFKLDAEEEEYALCVKKGNTELLQKINAILDVMVETHVVDFFVQKHSGAIL